jgi:hypothetical protein
MHLVNLGFKPYTHRLKRFRGERLAKAFPRYDRRLLMQFSETATIYDDQPSPGRLLVAQRGKPPDDGKLHP